MLTQLPILLLVTLSHCQSDDFVAMLSKIYGPKETVATNQPRGDPVVPPTQTVTGSEAQQECAMSNGQAGECVPYYRCKNKEIYAKNGGIDINSSSRRCHSYLDVCCQASDKIPSNQVIKPPPKGGQRVGCGWANPDGLDNMLISSYDRDEYTSFGEFPWMVAILKAGPLNYNDPKGKELVVYVGGGSLIHPSVVLTVAHYVANAGALKVRAGEWDTQIATEIYPFQERNVAQVETHKDFEKNTIFYDIAVLFLDKPMDLAPNVGVACLPPPRVPQKENTRCIATGWGKDKFGKEGRYQVTLKKIELPVVRHDDCQAALRRTRLGKHFQLHSTFMCAGGEPGKDTCRGDGGSPLSCPIEYETNRYVQSGIVAWGIGCGEDGTPGVYVDVSILRDWIDDKVLGKGYDPVIYTY